MPGPVTAASLPLVQDLIYNADQLCALVEDSSHYDWEDQCLALRESLTEAINRFGQGQPRKKPTFTAIVEVADGCCQDVTLYDPAGEVVTNFKYEVQDADVPETEGDADDDPLTYWHCPKCNHQQVIAAYALATVGTPHCPVCGNGTEMEPAG